MTAANRAVLDRNPEAALPRANGRTSISRNVYDLNPELSDTQFADYHGHGWNFRAILKRDREGNLLDKDGNIVAHDDPEKWRREDEGKFVEPGVNPGKTVHMMDIHAEKGLQCADCHFAQDSHGNGLIYTEVANAVEIGCKDCHGTADAYPSLRTSGPAAPPKGTDLSLLRNPDGRRRFEWTYGDDGRQVLIQRSIVDPELEWQVSLTRDSVDPQSREFTAPARAKLMSKQGAETGLVEFGTGIAPKTVHGTGLRFTCHVMDHQPGGCHAIEANWKTKSHHYGTEETPRPTSRRGARQMFRSAVTRPQGKSGRPDLLDQRAGAVRPTSTANGSTRNCRCSEPCSSQAFVPHFPHTVRLTETKTCDCHLSEQTTTMPS